jgi:hypothetical protein
MVVLVSAIVVLGPVSELPSALVLVLALMMAGSAAALILAGSTTVALVTVSLAMG